MIILNQLIAPRRGNELLALGIALGECTNNLAL